MNALPPILRDQRKIDADHLNLLAIFHYVGAGLAVLGILGVLVHFSLFNAFLNNPKLWQNQSNPPPIEIFRLFRWIYLPIGLWFVASGVLNLCSGLFLRARTHRTFCFLVAVLNCLHLPLGTVLGVFTIIVLSRDSVKEIYDAKSA